MAELDVTQEESRTETPSDPSDTGGAADASSGADRGASATEEPLYRELGYNSWDEMRQTHTRWGQQVRGSQAERQRLEQEIATRDARLADYERRANGTQQQQERPITLQEAVDASLAGDTQTVQRYEAQQQRTAAHSATTTLLQQLQAYTRPAQLQDRMVREFPELGTPTSALYRAVWDTYETEASNPENRIDLQDDPSAVVEIASPDGTERKRVDLRIARVAAFKAQVALAKRAGGQEEAERTTRANASSERATAGRQRRGGESEPPAWELMTSGEQKQIVNNLEHDEFPDDWPKTKEGVAAHLLKGWKKRDPERVRRRIEMHRAGMPIVTGRGR